MAMRETTSKRIRFCARGSGTFLPGNVIRYASDSEIKYWKTKGWIKRAGDMYILTKKGYLAV